MQQKNQLFLESQRPHYDRIVRIGGTQNMNLQGMVHVMKEEYDPHFRLDTSDPVAVCGFVKNLYARFDKWKSDNGIK